MWGVSSGSTTFTVTTRLYRGNSMIAEETGSYFTKSADQTFRVYFSQDILISAGVLHTATAYITINTRSFALNDGMESSSCSEIFVSFSESSRDINDSDVSLGQIPALIFRAPKI